MDKLFVIPKWSAVMMVVMGFVMVATALYAVSMGVYHGIQGRLDLFVVGIFAAAITMGLSGLCFWMGSHGEWQ